MTAATYSHKSPPPALTDRRHSIALIAATRSCRSPPALCCGCGHHLTDSEGLLSPEAGTTQKNLVPSKIDLSKRALRVFLGLGHGELTHEYFEIWSFHTA